MTLFGRMDRESLLEDEEEDCVPAHDHVHVGEPVLNPSSVYAEIAKLPLLGPVLPVRRLLTDSDAELPEVQRRILFLLRKQAPRVLRLRDISGALEEQCSWMHPNLVALMKRGLVLKPSRGRYTAA